MLYCSHCHTLWSFDIPPVFSVAKMNRKALHLRQLQVVQLFVHVLIIPFHRDQLVISADGGQSINHMGAEVRVHIRGSELAHARPVL